MKRVLNAIWQFLIDLSSEVEAYKRYTAKRNYY